MREYFLRRNHVQERTLVLQQLKLEREEGRSSKLLRSMLPEEVRLQQIRRARVSSRRRLPGAGPPDHRRTQVWHREIG